ncbi:MAG: hypothetical protein ACD_7C00082G0009 [uncultured bacterium]|nr:MAG: hypothetical protein ACD_7C00082G0009 [uncultured bacterium]
MLVLKVIRNGKNKIEKQSCFYCSVGNWGSLSFILNLGAFVQIWVRWFRLRHTSTPFSTWKIYFLGLSTDQ